MTSLYMYLQAFVRYWWLLVIVPLIGVAVAYHSSATARSQYQSVVTLQLNPAARSAFLPYGTGNTGSNEISVLAASYGEVLRSRAFAETVIERLNLPLAPEILASSISTALAPNTNILRITVTSNHPADAQWLAQSIAQIFVTETIQSQGQSAGLPSRLAEMEEAARGYPTRIAALRQQRDRLDQAVARGDLSRLTELNSLESRLAALESSHANLLVEINRARSSMNTASILDDASPAVRISGLPLSRTLPFGFASGLGIAVAVILGLVRLDNRIRGPWDVKTVTGAPPLVQVTADRADKRDRSTGRGVLVDPNRDVAEAFRILRADLYAARAEQPCRTIIVTSPHPGEGKTFVASNLAATCARAGERVLLVDGNLRHPCLDQLFEHSNGHGPPAPLQLVPALTQAAPAPSGAGTGTAVATVEAPPIAGVTASGHDNLSLLLTGPAVADAAPALAQLLPRLREHWDVVIVDSAPILPVADTRLLVANADAVLVVARQGQTTQDALIDCLSRVRKAGAAVVGVVLNNPR